MKIVLTEDELAVALRDYPAPAGYRVAGVSIAKYSSDFATIALEKIDPPAPVVTREVDPPARMPTVDADQPEPSR